MLFFLPLPKYPRTLYNVPSLRRAYARRSTFQQRNFHPYFCFISVLVSFATPASVLFRITLISCPPPSPLPSSFFVPHGLVSLTFLRRYYDETTKRIYPYLTAVIDVRDGVVRGMAWDDACIYCEKNECVPNTYNFDGNPATTEQTSQPVNGCSYTVNECAQFLAGDNNVCDLKLKVVWTGTDLAGRALLSSDSRPSSFPPNRIQENVKNRYNSMLERVNEIKDIFPGR